MNEKLRNLADNDPSIFHKVGLIFGSLLGFGLGVFISGRAEAYDKYLAQEIKEDEERES
jgi:F0F1-type ATP synthase assembly protein I